MSEVLLRGRELTRRWGGLVAVDRVSLELEQPQPRVLVRKLVLFCHFCARQGPHQNSSTRSSA